MVVPAGCFGSTLELSDRQQASRGQFFQVKASLLLSADHHNQFIFDIIIIIVSSLHLTRFSAFCRARDLRHFPVARQNVSPPRADGANHWSISSSYPPPPALFICFAVQLLHHLLTLPSTLHSPLSTLT